MLENPRRPRGVDGLLELSEELRNFYWNKRMETETAPDWEFEEFRP